MRILWLLIRLALPALRWARRGGVLVTVVAMLALNVATLVSETMNRVVSGLLDDVTGRPTLAQARARELRASRAELTRARSDLNTTRRELDASRVELGNARTDLDAERTARRIERDHARQAVRRQTSAISGKARSMALRNIWGLPAEAVPVVGVAANVAMTTWEITETCLMIHEAHELAVTFGVADPNDPARMEACGLQVPTTSDVWATICDGDAIPVPEGTPDLPSVPAAERGWWTALLCRSEPPAETALTD